MSWVRREPNILHFHLEGSQETKHSCRIACIPNQDGRPLGEMHIVARKIAKDLWEIASCGKHIIDEETRFQLLYKNL